MPRERGKTKLERIRRYLVETANRYEYSWKHVFVISHLLVVIFFSCSIITITYRKLSRTANSLCNKYQKHTCVKKHTYKTILLECDEKSRVFIARKCDK